MTLTPTPTLSFIHFNLYEFLIDFFIIFLLLFLQAPQNRLLAALPSYHFAVRCATLSAVALRVYSMDRALTYDKVWEGVWEGGRE